MAVLNLKIPDKVPFADWIDPGIRKTLAAHFGNINMDDVQFHKRLGADAICYMESDYCKVENILAMMETKEKYGTYPIKIDES